VSVHARSGIPAAELLDEAKDADLLVLGSRGAGGFARLLMGSVGTQVAHHAHCPADGRATRVRPSVFLCPGLLSIHILRMR